MNFKVDHSVGAGTSLQGYIGTTLETLTDIFGQPQSWDEGDKVTTEWTIVFDDGTIATIYDWKRYELGAPALDEMYEWHIGGVNKTAVEYVTAVLDKKLAEV